MKMDGYQNKGVAGGAFCKRLKRNGMDGGKKRRSNRVAVEKNSGRGVPYPRSVGYGSVAAAGPIRQRLKPIERAGIMSELKLRPPREREIRNPRLTHWANF
jgi:hypothetical protein